MAVPKFTTEEIPEVGVEGRREPERAKERLEMVSSQIEARGVRNPRVLEAMRQLERHRFIPADGQALAYRDGPVAIGQGQTISQPYIVACMTEVLEPQPTDRVLEIGTGSGYQTAVLAELVAEVHTVENVERLAKRAEMTLNQLGYGNISFRSGDGHLGWPEAAPFDKIIVTAAPETAGTAPTAEELIAWSRDRMAGFKVPRYVEFLDELPLNATGKVMKDKLEGHRR